MTKTSSRGPLGLNSWEQALLTPGPLGHNDAASPFSPAWHVGTTPGPLGINDHADPNVTTNTPEVPSKRITTCGAWNPEAAASFLKDPANGWAGTRSNGKCAKAVRQAINAGHIATPHNPVPATEYKEYLPKLGFVPVDLKDYTPTMGDIAVFPAIPGTALIYGHIEMYNGERWQSDYLQPAKANDGVYGKGFFANQKWSDKPFAIFRKGESK